MLLNSRQAYGSLTIVLHWLAAAAVLAMLYTGFTADWAADRETHRALMRIHVAVGASVFDGSGVALSGMGVLLGGTGVELGSCVLVAVAVGGGSVGVCDAWMSAPGASCWAG